METAKQISAKEEWAKQEATILNQLKQLGFAIDKIQLPYKTPIKSEMQLNFGNAVKVGAESITIKTNSSGTCSLGKEQGFAQLQVISLKQGKAKTIFPSTKKPDEYCHINAQAVGYLLNPDQAQAAVIIASKERGFEGPPHTVRLRVIGMQTQKGW